MSLTEYPHAVFVRVNKCLPALSKQHTTAVNAIVQMTGSKVTGNYIGSSELLVEPGNLQVPDISMDIGTAGSISLVVQATLLAARNYKQRFTLDLKGGTNVMWAPPIDTYSMVLFPLMERMGIHANLDIIRRGFYPIGGGEAKVTLEPMGNIKPLNLDSLGDLIGIRGLCFVQHLSDRIGQDMMDACKKVFSPKYEVDIEYQIKNKVYMRFGTVNRFCLCALIPEDKSLPCAVCLKTGKYRQEC